MRTVPLLMCILSMLGASAQPDGKFPRGLGQSCVFPPPDSVDVTGDGLADLVVRGMHGISTCDIPVSIGGCEMVVQGLPGTLLLGCLHPMGGRDVCGVEVGDTIPALEGFIQDDLRIPRYAFMDGAVRALSWSYGRNGVSEPQLTSLAKRVFVFGTTLGGRKTYGTFTLSMAQEQHTVRIIPGTLFEGDKPFIVR